MKSDKYDMNFVEENMMGPNSMKIKQNSFLLSTLLALRSETLMKYHSTACFAFLERQPKNIPLWNAINSQVRKASEAKPLVVAGISHEHTAPYTQ